jgi:hypothetical protein
LTLTLILIVALHEAAYHRADTAIQHIVDLLAA